MAEVERYTFRAQTQAFSEIVELLRIEQCQWKSTTSQLMAGLPAGLAAQLPFSRQTAADPE